MMTITLNGQPKDFGATLDITALLKAEGYEGMLVAVARNGTFVARESYSKTPLQNGDEIEIVAPMQGG